jgi:site-specific DNA recombinase
MARRARLLRAAVYYRRSSNKQATSIDRQRAAVEPYAAERYQIVAEYVDPGISGDEVEKRPAFRGMLDDAAAGKFDVILVDDMDRFGRFDSLTLGWIAKPLRDAGVTVVSVAQGPQDWESFGGRITAGVLAEGKATEAKDIGRRTLGTRLARAREGKWAGGVIPYGYALSPDRLGPDGKLRAAPLILGPADKVEVVKWIFRKVAEGWTCGAVARELNARAVPTPTGGRTWDRSTVRGIVVNRVYVGDAVWNEVRKGKYNKIAAGTITPSKRPQGKNQVRNATVDVVAVDGKHPPIIDRETWEKAQAALRANQRQSSPSKEPRPLTGLVICGHCGARMFAIGRSGEPRYLWCGGRHRAGRAACPDSGGGVREDQVLQLVADKLAAEYLNPERIAEVREEIRRQAEAARADGTADRLRKQVKRLTADITKGEARLLVIPEEHLPGAIAALEALKARRENVQAQLDAAEGKPDRDVEELIRRAQALAWRFREAIQEAEPLAVRRALQEILEHVELFVEPVPGQRKRWRLQKAVVHLATDSHLMGMV